VLDAESIAFDEAALGLLARAADGSMRDGLSLLDQAIAFGGGRVLGDDTRAMLGTRSGDLNLDLLVALADGDGARVLAEVGRIAELTPDFAGILTDLIALLHRLALAQQVSDTLTADDPDHERLADLAGRIAPEDVQLYYQVMLTGQPDLRLAPDPRTGLEMVLLRALAFRPDRRPSDGTEQRDPAVRERTATPPRRPLGGPQAAGNTAIAQAPATSVPNAERPPLEVREDSPRPARLPSPRFRPRPFRLPTTRTGIGWSRPCR